MIRLGVNVDHVATLRQLRAGTTEYPDLLKMVGLAVKGGAEQITIHLREDRRHIQEHDLKLLSKKCPVPLNLEMAPTNEMVRNSIKYRPDWVCLVPEKREELTTEGGLDITKNFSRIAAITNQMQKKKIKVSHFIDPDLDQVKSSALSCADAVEFHTGTWVLSKGKAESKEWQRLVEAALMAHQLGLKVHAGHGLCYKTTKKILRLPYLEEVNIGHSLICYAVEHGLEDSVRKMKKVLKSKG